jgi:hypothetical protein
VRCTGNSLRIKKLVIDTHKVAASRTKSILGEELLPSDLEELFDRFSDCSGICKIAQCHILRCPVVGQSLCLLQHGLRGLLLLIRRIPVLA